MKKTPLYDVHLKYGGRMVEFGGWLLPVQYSSLAQEHLSCRESVGIFDVSHMGELIVRGPSSGNFLQELVTNEVLLLAAGRAVYTTMCYPNGGCVDDLIIYRKGPEDFFICVNASNTEKDFQWIQEQAQAFLKRHHLDASSLSVTNVSDQYAQIAVQGPRSLELLNQCFSQENPQGFTQLKPFSWIEFSWKGKPLIAAATGYTGEKGCELYLPSELAPILWEQLFEVAQKNNIQALPCGLGARDTLRTEMKYPLYGHEISSSISPLDAGLGWVVKFSKPFFIGREALQAQASQGPLKTLVGLKSLSKAIPRAGYPVEYEGHALGEVTSGTFSPSLNLPIALALIDKKYSAQGTQVDVIVRNQKVPHIIVPTPFISKK